MTQLHCEITIEDDGTIVASSPELSMTILPDGEAKAFNRVGVKKKIFGALQVELQQILVAIRKGEMDKGTALQYMQDLIDSETPQEGRWLVGQLDGVYCYINGPNIILTKRDLNP